MSLKKSIAVLSATKPPGKRWHYVSAGTGNARIAELENQLGIEPSGPLFRMSAMNERIEELETKLSAKSSTPQARLSELEAQRAGKLVSAKTPTPVAMPAVAAAAPDYLKMSAADRHQFAQDGGTLSNQTFEALTPAAKMEFCKAGGKVAPKILKSFNTGNHV